MKRSIKNASFIATLLCAATSASVSYAETTDILLGVNEPLVVPGTNNRQVSTNLISASGTLTFSNPGVDYNAIEDSSIGGALGSLNVGKIFLAGNNVTIIEDWKSYAGSGFNLDTGVDYGVAYTGPYSVPGKGRVWPTKADADADPLNDFYYERGDITATNTGSFRLSSAASANVVQLKVKTDYDLNDDGKVKLGDIQTAFSEGYVVQFAPLSNVVTGGEVKVDKIVFDVATGQVIATVSGRSDAVMNGATVIKAEAVYAPREMTLWTFKGLLAPGTDAGADITGPTGVDPNAILNQNIASITNPAQCGTRCFNLIGTDTSGAFPAYTLQGTTKISNLRMTNEAIDFFDQALGLTGDAYTTLLAVNSFEGGWGGVEANFLLTMQEVQAVPEPSTYALMGIGLLGMGWMARRRKLQQSL